MKMESLCKNNNNEMKELFSNINIYKCKIDYKVCKIYSLFVSMD
jgi:hypothetical protein